MSDRPNYVGRFAPSPTGPLHFGSTVAALASWLDARAHDGSWHLRIEDLDPPREIAAAPAWIIDQLSKLGLDWDGDIVYQSNRLDAYEQALGALRAAGHVFPCHCSRKSTPPIYPGRCRGKRFEDATTPYAIRVQTDSRVITTDDRIQGAQHWHLDDDIGDFIVRRKDGLFSYQLAVVVDDGDAGITDIIRGDDLLDSTPRQLYLASLLDLPRPRYAHFPVVLGVDGHKLSKQAKARTVESEDPIDLLSAALRVLGQRVPARGPPASFLTEAVAAWDTDAIPRTHTVAPEGLQ